MADADNPDAPAVLVHNDCFKFKDFQFFQKTFTKANLDSLRKLDTDTLVDSLLNGNQPMVVDKVGKVWNGNHRLKVLQEKGYDIRKIIPKLSERHRK
ncbi:MAG: hypothetical protein AAFR90_14785 [Pseudomonadota bacterium]